MGNGLSLYRCPNSVGQLESRGLHGSCFLKVFRIMVLNIWTPKVYINDFSEEHTTILNYLKYLISKR